MQQRLPKFHRAPSAALPTSQITERSLNIIATIERYKLLPTSLLFKLIGGNERVTLRHLQTLYHTGYVNRFFFSFNSEAYYYLDNTQALRLVVELKGMDPARLDFEGVRRNKEKAHCDLNDPKRAEEMQGRALFLRHELGISRFHAMLELACRNSQGAVELLYFKQGPELWDRVQAQQLIRSDGTWQSSPETETLPHRLDALFGLRFTETGEERHFGYEYERKTNNATRFIKKLRAHFQYIVKARKHQQHHGVPRIRAILVETLDTGWVEHLREAARHPAVSGEKPSQLFWFTSSEYFTIIPEDDSGNPLFPKPPYLHVPELIFKPVWLSPVSNQPLSLFD